MSISPRHRIAALRREGMKPKSRVWAARGARGRWAASKVDEEWQIYE